MKGLFAPPELFAAYAYGVYDDDPDLVWGTHLRVFAGLGASFPLAPFAVFKIQSQVAEPPPFSIQTYDDYFDVTILPMAGGSHRLVRVNLPDPHSRYWRVALLDQHNRVVAVREQAPWQFAAPLLHRLRVWGDLDDLNLEGIAVNVDDRGFLDLLDPNDASVMGLPVNGPSHWYSGMHDATAGLDRAVRGAPLRLTPPDRPAGPFELADPSDAVEKVRLEAMLGVRDVLGGGLLQLVENFVSDDAFPWEQRDAQPFIGAEGKAHYVSAGRLAQLQMALFDPGLARVCGFADLIEDEAALDHHDHWDTLAMVGLFALEPRALLPRGVNLTGLHDEPDPHAGPLMEFLTAALKVHADDRDWAAELEESSTLAREEELLVAPFITLAAPVRPWLPPTLAPPLLRDHRWQTGSDNQPADRYRTTFIFPGAPATALCAQALRREDTWQTRHELLDVAHYEPLQRARPAVLGQTNYRFHQAGLLSDQDLPAEAGEITYRVHAADYFGRFGPPTDFALAPPPRPLPPPPMLRYQVEQAEIVDPLSPDPLSPGTLRLTVAVGQPGINPFTERELQLMGTATVVPRLEDLAAGAYALATLALTFNGEALPPIDLTTPGIFNVDWPLPALLPQAHAVWQLKGFFTDTAGNETDPDVRPGVEIKVTDRRPPSVYLSGVGLLWTSAPGPAPEVELTLKWQGLPKSRHNVYLTDRDGLGLKTDADIRAVLHQERWDAAWPADGTPPSRGLVAAIGCKRVLNEPHAVGKEVFRLLTDPPLEADDTGRVVLRTTLPRSLATVQFIRIVPLGPDGGEPPFGDCGVIPVAVPESRRPPAPQLSGSVDPDSGVAALAVTADGFNRSFLAADEPGLFTPGANGSESPRCRIRRAVGAVAAPIYARPLGDELALRLDDPNEVPPVFSAVSSDDNGGAGLAPFVPYVYWAEVGLPDERQLPAGWLEEDGGLDPLHDERKQVQPVYDQHKQPHPRPFSLPSPPLTLMYVPTDLPAALAAESVAVVRQLPDALGQVALTLTLADPPHSHPKAVGRYRLAVWGQWPEQPLQRLSGADDAWPVAEDGSVSVVMPPPEQGDAAGPLWLRLMLVDPVGRYGAITPLLVEEPPLSPLPPALSTVKIQGTLLAGRPIGYTSWHILQPASPDPLAEYVMTVRVEQHGGPPLTLTSTLDQVPELTWPALLTLEFNQLARVARDRQYILRLKRNRPVRVEVTLTDPLGRSITESGQSGP